MTGDAALCPVFKSESEGSILILSSLASTGSNISLYLSLHLKLTSLYCIIEGFDILVGLLDLSEEE